MNSFDDVFKEVCKYCKKKVEQGELTDVAYKLWLEPLEPVKMEGNDVYFRFRSDFQKDTTLHNYGNMLKEAFLNIMGFEVNIKPVMVFEENNDDNDEDKDDTKQKRIELENSYLGAQYDYTFNTFIVGKSNELAYAASKTVAENIGKIYNPFFIHGHSGLGKTHLITAISNEIRKNNPNMNIIYVTGEEFTNELISAIKQKRDTSEFHNKYRNADVLLIDDVQFIAGKETTQEEFFHTFNELHKTKRQIVLTSDRPPKEIKTLEERIRTRFEWGLITDISIPDFETRFAIVKRKAELLRLDISDEVADYISNALKSNIRQLEGCVLKLKASNHLVGVPCTIEQAKIAVSEVLTDVQPIPVTIERILNETANIYGTTADDIRSSKRSSKISTARKISSYIIKEITDMSYKAIGLELGGRDHSTIMYQYDQIKETITKDQKLREIIEDIINNINSK